MKQKTSKFNSQCNPNLTHMYIKEHNQFQGFRVNGENEAALVLQRLRLIDCPVLKFLSDLRRWISLFNACLLILFREDMEEDSVEFDGLSIL